MTVQTQIKVTDAMLMHLVKQPRSLCKITTFLKIHIANIGRMFL